MVKFSDAEEAYRKGFADAVNVTVEAVWDKYTIGELQTWREEVNEWHRKPNGKMRPDVIRHTMAKAGTPEAFEEELQQIENHHEANRNHFVEFRARLAEFRKANNIPDQLPKEN